MCPKTCPVYLSIGVCGKEKGWGRLVSLSERTKVNPWEHDKVALGQNVLSFLLLSIFSFLFLSLRYVIFFFLDPLYFITSVYFSLPDAFLFSLYLL
jgi:hypothetical protein